MSATFGHAVSSGRHRWGLTGLIHVRQLIDIRPRNFFTAWFRTGRHRALTPVATRPTPIPAARVA